MTERRWEQVAAATGLVFVAGLVAGVVIVPEAPPQASDPASEIVSHFSENRGAILIGGYLIGFASLFGLWFLGTLRHFLARAEGGTARLSAVAFGSGLVGGALVLVSAAVSNGLAFRVAESGDEVAVVAMFDVANMALALSAFPIAAWLAATAIVVLRTKALPAWYGVVTDVVALAFIPLGSAAYTESGILASGGGYGLIVFLLFLLWIVATSFFLILRAGRGEDRMREPVPAISG